MASHFCKIFMYVALPCEGKPLAEYFKLKKDTTIQPIDVYFQQDVCLTITGPGKSAMAAGVAYSQALFSAAENPVLLNIGIAGHPDHALGSAYLIDRIIDCDSLKNHYPPLVFIPVCATESLRTASRPQLDYEQPHLCDMEGSAFYETAARFTSAELAQSIKVVSDNRMSPADRIKPQQVSALIAAHLQTIEATLAELSRLAESVRISEPEPMAALTRRYRFTASEQVRLRQQLNRWNCLTDGRELAMENVNLATAGDVLYWLEQQIEQQEFYL